MNMKISDKVGTCARSNGVLGQITYLLLKFNACVELRGFQSKGKCRFTFPLRDILLQMSVN